MRTTKIGILIVAFNFLVACQDQLDVKNPNQPTVDALNTESGIISFAQGGVYVNGFQWNNETGALPYSAIHDRMADVIGSDFGGYPISTPELVTLNDGSTVPNPLNPPSQVAWLRLFNTGTYIGMPVEWYPNYAMNNACNILLNHIDQVKYTGDTDTKKGVLRAWAYFWKGYAYSRIGSMYYAGLINNDPVGTNGLFKSNKDILAEAENNFAAAETILNGLTANADYNNILGSIIPDFNQVGLGGVLTPGMWKKTINTFRARNLLANKVTSTMTTADWDQILSLANNGIGKTDLVFTGRSNENGDFFQAQYGTVASATTGDPHGRAATKISERLIQDFRVGDLRKDNNFAQVSSPWLGQPERGNSFNTRWELLDGGNGLPGVIQYSNLAVGAYELFLSGCYEENELMKSEANIYKGGANIETGLQIIDAVRIFQGAGLPALAGTGKTQAQAIAELRSERRVALLFRGVAFYDARRWGIIEAGAGRSNTVVVDNYGNLNTNAKIEYHFLDYWDVPNGELIYNPAAPGSAAIVNPKN